MNFEINDYDCNPNIYENNNNKKYKEEYEFQNSNKILNNNIYPFIPQNILPKEINNKANNNQNSFLNSNNVSPFEDQNYGNYNSSNKSNYFEENFTPSPLNIRYNNYENNYLNENNSINLLNLTDKIYEDDEHFKKKIISTKNINTLEKRKNKNKNLNKKFSKDIVNKKCTKKSLFINNNNKKKIL